MSRGIITKGMYEVWAVTLLCGAGIFLFEVLIAYILQSFGSELTDQWLFMAQMEFFQKILKSLLGADIGSQFGPGAMGALAWVHPLVLALLWSHEITICTRMPAEEVDRGTIDVLLALPVSRWRVYTCETAVWMISGAFVTGLALVGFMLGDLIYPERAVAPPSKLLAIVANLYCLYLAVGAMARLTSSLSERRGRAVAAAFAIVLVSFLLNFLAQFWEPAQSISFLSVLHYYTPLLILRESGWPIADMVVLVGCAGLFWLAGGIVFARRDICTV